MGVYGRRYPLDCEERVMGKHIDEDDAKTLEDFLLWLDEPRVGTAEELVAAFLAARRAKREAAYK